MTHEEWVQTFVKLWGHPTAYPSTSHCTCNPCMFDRGNKYTPIGGIPPYPKGCQNCGDWIDGTPRCTVGCWTGDP